MSKKKKKNLNLDDISFDKKEELKVIEPVEKKTTCMVNMRSGKTTQESNVIIVLDKGTKVKCIEEGKWDRIITVVREDMPGVTFEEFYNGYIMSEFLK